jgi:hypothetical protein
MNETTPVEYVLHEPVFALVARRFTLFTRSTA